MEEAVEVNREKSYISFCAKRYERLLVGLVQVRVPTASDVAEAGGGFEVEGW